MNLSWDIDKLNDDIKNGTLSSAFSFADYNAPRDKQFGQSYDDKFDVLKITCPRKNPKLIIYIDMKYANQLLIAQAKDRISGTKRKCAERFSG